MPFIKPACSWMRALPAWLLALALLAPPGALADETMVRARFMQRFPTARLERVARSPLAGLYEVYSDGRVWYVDEDVNFVFSGTLVDARSRRNLTEQSLRRYSAVPLSGLPLDLAIRIVRGDGSRQVAIFQDPACATCQQLERELIRVNNITVYVFLLPMERQNPGTTLRSTRIWCSGNRAEAWLWSVVQGGRLDGPEDCITPFAQIAELARRYYVSTTPTMIFADGSRISGSLTTDRIEQALDNVQRRLAEARAE